MKKIIINAETDTNGKIYVPLKEVLDVIDYFTNIIDKANDYNKQNIGSNNLNRILKGDNNNANVYK